MAFARRVAKALKKAIDCQRVGVAVLGMEVPHTHVHLIPLQKESDMNFSNPKKEFSSNEMSAIADQISLQVSD